MFSKKIIIALALAALSSLFICNTYAQLLPGSTEINLGDFKITSAVSKPGIGVYQIGRAPVNSLSTNSLPMNNSTINNTSMINTQPASTQLQVLDLTGYAKGRLNKNLTGYTNIMYPFGESRGSTAATSSSSGCGCG